MLRAPVPGWKNYIGAGGLREATIQALSEIQKFRVPKYGIWWSLGVGTAKVMRICEDRRAPRLALRLQDCSVFEGWCPHLLPIFNPRRDQEMPTKGATRRAGLTRSSFRRPVTGRWGAVGHSSGRGDGLRSLRMLPDPEDLWCASCTCVGPSLDVVCVSLGQEPTARADIEELIRLCAGRLRIQPGYRPPPLLSRISKKLQVANARASVPSFVDDDQRLKGTDWRRMSCPSRRCASGGRRWLQ